MSNTVGSPLIIGTGTMPVLRVGGYDRHLKKGRRGSSRGLLLLIQRVGGG